MRARSCAVIAPAKSNRPIITETNRNVFMKSPSSPSWRAKPKVTAGLCSLPAAAPPARTRGAGSLRGGGSLRGAGSLRGGRLIAWWRIVARRRLAARGGSLRGAAHCAVADRCAAADRCAGQAHCAAAARYAGAVRTALVAPTRGGGSERSVISLLREGPAGRGSGFLASLTTCRPFTSVRHRGGCWPFICLRDSSWSSIFTRRNSRRIVSPVSPPAQMVLPASELQLVPLFLEVVRKAPPR